MFNTPARTCGTFNTTNTTYIIYYGSKNKESIKYKIFYDIDSADEFFKQKQKDNVHVEAYKETIHSTITIENLSK